MSKLAISDCAKVGVCAAVLCVLGPVSFAIPVSPVPVSLATFAVCLISYLLGAKRGVLCVGVYLLIGCAGVPVFSGFGGGIGKLAGPTGGYLIGYLFIALAAGWCSERFRGRIVYSILGMFAGTLACYATGTAWLAYQVHLTFTAALAAGVLPYMGFDILKMFAAALLGKTVGKRLG